MINRTPPKAIQRQLRREIAFRCPVDGCGSPYLSFHHFDPPFAEEQHHRPQGMIALCGEHHTKADSGAFTVAQLRAMKHRSWSQNVSGEFNWLRHRLIAFVGGTVAVDTPVIISRGSNPIIWLSRDVVGCWSLNIDLEPLLGTRIFSMTENCWEVETRPTDIESPPGGRTLEASFSSGEMLRVEFQEMSEVGEARRLFGSDVECDPRWFPMTGVAVGLFLPSIDLQLGSTTRAGGLTMASTMVVGAQAALVL